MLVLLAVDLVEFGLHSCFLAFSRKVIFEQAVSFRLISAETT